MEAEGDGPEGGARTDVGRKVVRGGEDREGRRGGLGFVGVCFGS